MKNTKHVYVIVRHGDFATFTIVKVATDEAYALQEVERLNKVNQGKGCRYVSQMIKLDESTLAERESL